MFFGGIFLEECNEFLNIRLMSWNLSVYYCLYSRWFTSFSSDEQVSVPSLVQELDLVNKAWPPSLTPTPMVSFVTKTLLYLQIEILHHSRTAYYQIWLGSHGCPLKADSEIQDEELLLLTF